MRLRIVYKISSTAHFNDLRDVLDEVVVLTHRQYAIFHVFEFLLRLDHHF